MAELGQAAGQRPAVVAVAALIQLVPTALLPVAATVGLDCRLRFPGLLQLTAEAVVVVD